MSARIEHSLSHTGVPPSNVGESPGYDVAAVRRDFPILTQKMRGRPLIYLDNAASAQKPQCVIDAISNFYAREYANIHRGIYELSEMATRRYEDARSRVQRFIGARSTDEIVFVRNATEAINLIAGSFGRRLVAGDEILITTMEHHANIVPWQLLCESTGAVLRVAPVNDRGELLLDELEKYLTPRTRLFALTHASNALGTLNPVHELTAAAHTRGIPILIDGAQAVPRLPVNVSAIDCDFYAFSGHKLYGPSGIGVLYGKRELLADLPPYQGGGEMITSVSFEKTLYKAPPHRFEAGTPHIAGAVGLAAAIDYLEKIGMQAVFRHETELLEYGTEQLSRIPGLRLIGTAAHKVGVLSFVIEGIHPHDIGTVLDQAGIAIRAGHHCAQPVLERMGVPATARASLGLFNTRADLDALVRGLYKTLEVFR